MGMLRIPRIRTNNLWIISVKKKKQFYFYISQDQSYFIVILPSLILFKK